MGVVHAKALGTERMQPEKRHIALDRIKARVDRVHVDGIARTKDDILISAVKEMFQARNFQQVLVTTHHARKHLETLDAFKHIGILIDTSKGPDATPDGLEVTFHVTEKQRVSGGISTVVGTNEGGVMMGMKFPNMLGRGEGLETAYQIGTRRSSGFVANFTKPLLRRGTPRISGQIFQQSGDFPANGFRETDRGTLLRLIVNSAPDMQHTLSWEGIWREISCLSPATSFAVREEAGHSLKSSIKHALTVDKRDNAILPSEGILFRLLQEYAGLGGDVGFLKHEVELQVNQSLPGDMVLQGCFRAGFMKRNSATKSFNIADRFFLGGPLSLRGFGLRGVGPHSEENYLGAETYWVSGLHLYTPLPFRPGRSSFGDFFRTHLFLNLGNIGNFTFVDDYHQNLITLLTNLRLSSGFGIVLSLSHWLRFELNYCFPLRLQPGDRANPGLQFGIGTEFL